MRNRSRRVTPEVVSDWMGYALEQAAEASAAGEVPVGAVVIRMALSSLADAIAPRSVRAR